MRHNENEGEKTHEHRRYVPVQKSDFLHSRLVYVLVAGQYLTPAAWPLERVKNGAEFPMQGCGRRRRFGRDCMQVAQIMPVSGFEAAGTALDPDPTMGKPRIRNHGLGVWGSKSESKPSEAAPRLGVSTDF
ncbi:hypothetical protein HJFPF1_06336 [Paramyrothecium foliicola]|nr:hypothetical protein HJFPF1_06336 [Paramyrothecium foliicola]